MVGGSSSKRSAYGFRSSDIHAMTPGRLKALIASSLLILIVGLSTAFLIAQIPKDPFIPPRDLLLKRH